MNDADGRPQLDQVIAEASEWLQDALGAQRMDVAKQTSAGCRIGSPRQQPAMLEASRAGDGPMPAETLQC